MGTGKTEVGRELSRLLGMPVVDTDREVEKSEGSTINEIFSLHGEEYFRKLETAIIQRIASGHGCIISTGGGAILREENVRALKSAGIIFCLMANPATILHRIEGDEDRPLLRCEDRKTRIIELLEQRKPFYEKAGIMIDTEGKTPLQVAEEIIGKVSWKR